MILHGYGCSWTEGEGADIEIENTITDREKKKIFRNTHSWVNGLANKLNINSINNGISSNANNKIFNQVIIDIQNFRIKRGDFVVIMWSSSLRDYVPFLPTGEWISWSVKHLLQTPEKFINSYKSSNTHYDEFMSYYKDFFVGEMFNQNYYNIVNQNYILFLQKMFEFYDIKYLMCDGLESMFIDLHKKDNITHLINKTNYWGFKNKTFRDFLNTTNKLDIWEYQDVTYKTRATQHPNKNGYNLISEELYNYIVGNNII